MKISTCCSQLAIAGTFFFAIFFTPALVSAKDLDSYLPVLETTMRRVLPLDPSTKLYVNEVRKNLFVVSDGVYQSAFLKTGKGIIVLDAPASYSTKLPEIIKHVVPDEPVKYLIYSHSHKDHIGGSREFKSIKGLKVISHQKVAETIQSRKDSDLIPPNVTFKDSYTLKLGSEKVELTDHGNFHSSDADIFIYMPKQKFLYVMDVMAPGYVPFKGLDITANVERYLSIFDDILHYDFDLFLGGHLNILGNRQDVKDTQSYVHDIETISKHILRKTSPAPFFKEVFSVPKNVNNGYLGYRYFLDAMAKECALLTIEKWKDRLSGVDVWAESHCATIQDYLRTH